MPVVSGIVVGAGHVALGANPVALDHQLVAVGVVAVGADHTRLMHFALNKRAVDVDFVANLPVGPVERLLDDREAVGIKQWPTRVVLAQGAAPSVTSPAGINLLLRGQQFTALCDIGAFCPPPFTPRFEAHCKPGLGGRQAPILSLIHI